MRAAAHALVGDSPDQKTDQPTALLTFLPGIWGI